MNLFLISLIPYAVFTISKTLKSIHMMQQNYYNDGNRFLNWIICNIKKVAFEVDVLFVLLIFTIFFILFSIFNFKI